MRPIRFIACLCLSVGFVYVFDSVKLGPIPPLGKFFSPSHGFWKNAEKGDWSNSEKTLPGLHAEVDVFVDSHATAHISARNNYDLYFMQGYVTARDRLWQMDFTTRVAAGRLSEIIGGKTLEIDRFFRRIGLMRAAKSSLEAFKQDQSSWEAVTAYSAGVNAWIENLSYAEYPIEYKLMGYEPEPWEPVKCALMAKLMAFNLAGGDDDMQMTHLLEEYGPGVVEKLFPDFPDSVDPVVPGDWGWIGDSTASAHRAGRETTSEETSYKKQEANKPQTTNFKLRALPSVTQNSKPKTQDLFSFTAPSPNNGSNNWAVAGSKTVTGKPMLANDTHLSLWLPCTWYMIQLTSPDVNVMGATLPGAPSVIIGFNDSIAWGVTNAQRDVRDWYKDAAVTSQVVDTILIRGRKPFYDRVSYTHFGPIVYDETFTHSHADTMRQGLAMKWAAHEPSNELAATLALNRARNFDEYLSALKDFQCPGQNFVFASVSGDIAIKQQGRFPNLAHSQGQFIMDGSDLGNDWPGWIPSEFNPMMKNPMRGFVSSANQGPTGKRFDEHTITETDIGMEGGLKHTLIEIEPTANYPYYYNGNFEFYRNRVINSTLAALTNSTVDHMRELQNSTYSLLAAELLPVVLRSLELSSATDDTKELGELLANWDRFYKADSRAAVVFDMFYDHLYELTFDEFVPKRLYPVVEDYVFISLLKTHPNDTIFDIRSTPEKETAADVIVLAFEEMLKQVQGDGVRTWGDSREVRLQHATRGIPSFDRVLHIGGEEHCVNAMDSDHGAAWRMVVSLEDDVKAWAVYPGGQSGNPGSSHYDDFVNEWASGELLELVFLHAMGAGSGLVKHTFKP